MARYTTGYLSEDGVFFPTEIKAEMHDSEMAIRAGCATLNINADRYIAALEALAEPTWGYLSGYQKINGEKVDPAHENTASAGGNTSNDNRRSTSIDSLEQQPVGGHEPLSDLGDSS